MSPCPCPVLVFSRSSAFALLRFHLASRFGVLYAGSQLGFERVAAAHHSPSFIPVVIPEFSTDFDENNDLKGESLINVNVTCDGSAGEGQAGGAGSASSSPCSDGSLCLNGDLGVYCTCYVRESSLEKVRVKIGSHCLVVR